MRRSHVSSCTISENVSLSDKGPSLEPLEFFETSHGSYEPLNLLHTNPLNMFERNVKFVSNDFHSFLFGRHTVIKFPMR